MNHIFKVLQEENCQPRILYPVKMSFKKKKLIKDMLRQAKELK